MAQLRLSHRVAVVAVALALAPVLVSAALLVLAHPYSADAAYLLPGFPEPRIDDLSDDERSRLAAVGAHAIQPWRPDGMEAMRAAQRDDGRRAFDADELAHFEDVRDLVTVFLLAGLVGAGVIAAAAVRDRSLVRRGLAAGARLTIGAFALLSVLMLIGFGAFFDAFHGVFFAGDTWKLPRFGTVRSLYPDEYWGLMGGAMAVLVLGLSALILAVVHGRVRVPRIPRARRSPLPDA